MKKNKIITYTFFIILGMIVVPTIYKIYTNHNNNLERVIKEEFLYQAKICYKENNCESKILLKDLYEKEYIKERLTNPLNKKYYEDSSYIDLEKNEIKFKVQCSKGTYIRTLCESIAEKIGTIGYMKELNRTQVGRFHIRNSITIEELEKRKEQINQTIITMQELFKEYPKISLEEKEYQKFLNGVKLLKNKEDGIYNIYQKEEYIGIGIIKEKKLKRDIILA